MARVSLLLLPCFKNTTRTSALLVLAAAHVHCVRGDKVRTQHLLQFHPSAIKSVDAQDALDLAIAALHGPRVRSFRGRWELVHHWWRKSQRVNRGVINKGGRASGGQISCRRVSHQINGRHRHRRDSGGWSLSHFLLCNKSFLWFVGGKLWSKGQHQPMFDDFFEGNVEKQSQEFKFGEYSVSVMCVHGENQHIDKWVPLVVWRAAEAFGQEFTSGRMHELANKSVIELGSGTGLCGLLAAKISGKLTLLTDGNEDSLEALEESIELNKMQSTVKSHVCEWGNLKQVQEIKEKFGDFEVCIATDVIYDKISIHPLLISAMGVLPEHGGGTFILANHRYRFVGLLEEIQRCLQFEKSLVLQEITRIGTDVDLFVFRKV